MNSNTSIKVIGTNGQISLGKEYAGRQVLVEECQPGVWLIRTAVVIPENELWLHTKEAKHNLASALDWAAGNPPKASDPKAIINKLEHAKKSKRKSN